MHINPAVIMPQPYRGDSAIRSSVCLPVGLSHGAAALGYRHAGCLQLSHRRPPEMYGLRTRPRTDTDPPRVEQSSTRAYRLAAPAAGNDNLLCIHIKFRSSDVLRSVWGPEDS